MEKVDEGAVVIARPAQLQKQNFFDLDMDAQIERAKQYAVSLNKLVKENNLSINFGKDQEYLPVEVWQTLGAFLGVLPKERSVNCLSDGSYEAFVDLVRVSDGVTVGGGSAICGMDEQWAQRKKFARRSMAITRATGKAYRSAFSWIMVLGGYAPTPAEEMPGFEDKVEKVVAEIVEEPVKKRGVYMGTEEDMVYLKPILIARNIPSDMWDVVGENLKGRPSKDLPKILKELGL